MFRLVGRSCNRQCDTPVCARGLRNLIVCLSATLIHEGDELGVQLASHQVHQTKSPAEVGLFVWFDPEASNPWPHPIINETIALMGKLIYLISTSLDGYVADKNGNFDWAMPSEEVHSFVNDTLRNVGTILMGRNLYETMKVWDEIPTEGTGGPMDGPSEAMNDYAKIWRAAKKIVYSTSLSDVTIANATVERSFEPNTIQKLVVESDKDFDIGGPHLAAEAIKAGIVDEYHQIIVPIMIGGGNHWLPKGANGKLELVDMRKFANGFVHLQYRKV